MTKTRKANLPSFQTLFSCYLRVTKIFQGMRKLITNVQVLAGSIHKGDAVESTSKRF